jgi:hypothetical protein
MPYTHRAVERKSTVAPDIEDQLKAIPRNLPVIGGDIDTFSARLLSTASLEGVARPGVTVGHLKDAIQQYNAEAEWYNDKAREHDDRLEEYKRSATGPDAHDAAITTYLVVRIGDSATSGLSLSLGDAEKAFKRVEDLVADSSRIPAVFEIREKLTQAREMFKRSQAVFARLGEDHVAIHQILTPLAQFSAFSALRKPQSVDTWNEQVTHKLTGVTKELLPIEAPLAELHKQLTGLEQLSRENPVFLRRLEADLWKSGHSTEYVGYLKLLSSQVASIDRSWTELKRVVNVAVASDRVRNRDMPAIDQIRSGLTAIDTDVLKQCGPALDGAIEAVANAEQTIADRREQARRQALRIKAEAIRAQRIQARQLQVQQIQAERIHTGQAALPEQTAPQQELLPPGGVMQVSLSPRMVGGGRPDMKLRDVQADARQLQILAGRLSPVPSRPTTPKSAELPRQRSQKGSPRRNISLVTRRKSGPEIG